MRKVVREEQISTVQVMEYKQGKVELVGELKIPGFVVESKASRLIKKQYPNRNVFCGEIRVDTYRYEMGADKFRELATKKEVTNE